MAWESNKTFQLVHWDDVPVAVGFVTKRHCGCSSSEGFRLDLKEPVVNFVSCDEHGAQVARAHETIQNMPPQNRSVSDLFIEQLEVELAP